MSVLEAEFFVGRPLRNVRLLFRNFEKQLELNLYKIPWMLAV